MPALPREQRNSGLQGTLKGNDVQSGFEDVAGLGPDAAAALQAAITSRDQPPNEEDIRGGEELAARAFQSVNQEIEDREPPEDVPLPGTAGPLGTFLALFSANLGAQLAQQPQLAQPTIRALERQEQQRAATEAFNFKNSVEFRSKRMKDRLTTAAKQAEEALDLALKSRDQNNTAKAAANLSRLNSLLRREEEQVRGAGRQGLEGQKQEGRSTLESQKQGGRSGFEDEKQAGRIELEGVKQEGREALVDKRAAARALDPKAELTASQFNDDLRALTIENRQIEAEARRQFPPLTGLTAQRQTQTQKGIAAAKEKNFIARRTVALRRQRIDLSLQRQPGDTADIMLDRLLSAVPEFKTKSADDPEVKRALRIIQQKFPSNTKKTVISL